MSGGGSGGGTTTTVQKSDPWSGQQPSLLQQFATANQLFFGPNGSDPTAKGYDPQAFGHGSYDPQYFPGSTVAGFNPIENNALSWATTRAADGSPVTDSAKSMLTQTENGAYLGSNAGNPYYASLLNGTGLGQGSLGQLANGTSAGDASLSSIMAGNGPGNLGAIASGQFLGHNPGDGTAASIASGQPQSDNPVYRLLGGMASGANAYSNPVNGLVGGLASGQGVNANPANGDLASYANGSMLSAGNPYFQSMAGKVAAQVMPSIMSTFTQGGAVNSPGAAYAASSGLSDAIGALANQDYLTGQQNQLAAAGQLGQNYNQGVANQIGAAGLVGNAYGLGQQNQLAAAGQIGQTYDHGIDQQLQGAGLLSSNFNQGIGNMLSAGSGLLSNATSAAQGLNSSQGQAAGQLQQGAQSAAQGLSTNYNDARQQQLQGSYFAPTLANTDWTNIGQLLQTGQTMQGQSQNQLNDAISHWNYQQNMPLNMLNAFAGVVNGNYGQTLTTQQPYYTNTGSNVMGGLMGLGSLGLGAASLFGGGGAAAGGASILPMLAALA